MNQLAILALISLASLFTAGSITVFNFSWNLQSVPLAIVGASYSLAAFPTLSRLFSDGEMERFMAQMQTALRHIIFWSIPALVLFIVLRAQIVRTVLGAGEFGWAATRLTAGSLALFAFSVLAQSVILLLVRGYYAAGNTVKPLITNVIGGVLIIGFAIGLTYLFNTVPEFAYFIEALFRVEHLSGTVVLMLPLAFSLGTFVNAGLLYWLFQRDIGSFSDDLYRTTFYIIGASIIMGFATYHLLGVMVTVFDTSTVVGIFLQGLTAGLGGILVCILVLWSLGSRELAEMYAALKERYWRIDVSGIDETSGTPH